MASCSVGEPGYGERLYNLEREFEVQRARLDSNDKWKEILENWILHNFSYDIQRELWRRTQGESNTPYIAEKPAMSAIEYNAVNVGNANSHQHQHAHPSGATMIVTNSAANILCNYCPPAAKRKKPNMTGETIQMITADGRQLQQRTVTNATIAGTAVPISLTPVTNALIRQDTRFNAEEFDPVKIFGELTTGFNPAAGSSNLLDHTTRILSFTSDGSRIEESLEIKRAAVAATKTFPGTATGGVQVPNTNNHRGDATHTTTKKTGKGKKGNKGSKASAAAHSHSHSDPSKSSGSSPKRKLKSMSIEEKYYVLQRLLKPDVSQATICEEMQLNKSVVSRIWCDRFKIEELYKQGSGNRIKVKYMHNGPAHPKKRGHGKKAKALAKQSGSNSSNKNSHNNSDSSHTSSSGNTTTSSTSVVNTPSTTYHQSMQNLNQPTFARPTLLGLYTASAELNAAGRSYEANNVPH